MAVSISSEELITAILDRPVLWNASDPDHSNDALVKRKWNEIKLFSKVDVIELKKKWKNMKDQYRKEVKKSMQAKEKNPDVDYRSSWKHFRRMSFLRDQLNSTNLKTRMDTADQFSDYDDEEEDKKDVLLQVSPAPFGDTDVVYPESTYSPAPSQSSVSISRKRKGSNDLQARLLKLEQMETMLQERESRQGEECEDFHYLMSLLPQMKKFSPAIKFLIRNKINSIMLNEIELQNTSGDPLRPGKSGRFH